MVNILKSRFTIRLDLQRKIIEHVEIITETKSVVQSYHESGPSKKSKVTSDETDDITVEEEKQLLAMDVECKEVKEKHD